MPKGARGASRQDPRPDYRKRQRLSNAQGLAASHVAQAVKNYERCVADMEAALASCACLAGDAYSLADAAPTPHLVRAEAIGLDGLWAAGRRPKVADWYARIKTRPSFGAQVVAPISGADHERFTVPKDETWARAKEVLEFETRCP